MGGTTRRGFLGTAAAAGAGGGIGLGVPGRASARDGSAAGTVAVLGGGVAGLTAAHELAERGFRVTVYERKALGGKARSMDVPDSGKGGRAPLPGEHGFRFIPGIYHNLPDTMRRIPFPGNAHGVHDNLVAPKEMLFARSGGREDIRVPLPWPGSTPAELTPDEIRRALTSFLDTALRLPLHEALYFANRLLVFLTSCDERRDTTWERMPWWEFVRAGRMSYDYQRILAVGITRNIVATKAEEASTRTVGTLLEAFAFNLLGRGADGPLDRILNAPTNEAWIDPWATYLRSLGVEFRLGWTVQDLTMDTGRVAGAVVKDPGGVRRTVTADHYISAMPVEHARRTWNAAVRAADPQLAACDRLETDWMTGIQFYLTERTPILHGHLDLIDSPWSLTAIAQAQHWPGHDFPSDFGDGTVADCLSVDVSEWDRPGILYGKTAKQCTRAEVAREVWAQLKAALNDSGRTVLKDSVLHSWFLDPAVDGLGTPAPVNEEQLLIHPVGTFHLRPRSATRIPNLFLSGDYVSVPIDLATMEGANTSARQAVNALLDSVGSAAERCTVTPLYRAPEFEPLKRHDRTRHLLGLPNLFDVG
ncbi:FAD-dependent oxidoreductase [Streptomyces scabiei]|uniref:hydroxysqualene dehydroxylase n=1 Tax=Streptomyces scabiei TaxID=1930 RepID=UPI001B30518C|nr:MULTISPECIES: FAD-dependent oxidoreductase [Streptomyces]MBP5865348.1 FAD-dependent oxidoreductase [Streptomyces sp. LBUM 1484]MBP5933419.1 FAD-dependent oxidoreductase [Streptomyces sp. LBUM 1479]MBP5873966.1 FAD-dependent oxidoreductase [Streptomyces sp. LBUM 1477]MBP5881681.1 FAD-dependent oxidoreductase [Streptomyces sp. LBUM 1487]MBP5897453.1 FAD-dependent oxidoreductase [Streptomyces sp. LBUM 1488]